MRRALALFTVLFAVLSAHAQHALTYPKLILFGDNYSDTLNTYNATESSSTGYDQDGNPVTLFDAYPSGQYGYQDGTFTNGPFYNQDTSFFPHDPATYLRGVWEDQLHDQLPGVPFAASTINAGIFNPYSNNYAWGSATTGNGTTSVTFAGHLTAAVHNMNRQIDDYLNAGNTPDSQSLYVLFGGLNDLLNDSSATNVTAAAANVTAEAKRLIDAGAVNILIANVPHLSANNSSPIDVAALSFRTQLNADLASLQAGYALNSVANHITTLDLYTLYANIMALPAVYGITNVTSQAILLPNADPNTYLNWDGVNPTTAGHHQIAIAACTALTGTKTTLTVDKTTATLASPATLTATVSTAGTYGPQSTLPPTGSVTFYYLQTVLVTTSLVPLGTVPINANGQAKITSASLPADVYTIYAVYSGDTNFATGCNSNELQLTVAVATSSFDFSFSPPAAYLGMEEGAAVVMGPRSIGGFTGTVTFSCTSLPRFFTCDFYNSTAQVTTDGSTYYSNLFIASGQVQKAQLSAPPITPARRDTGTALATLCAAPLLLLFIRRRKIGKLQQAGLLMLVLVLSITLFSAAGCAAGAGKSTASQGSDPGFGTTHGPGITYAAPGTYPVNITATNGTLSVTHTYYIYIADTYDVGVIP